MNYSTQRRLHLLIQLISGVTHYSLRQIMQYLNDSGITVSERTIKRDFQTLRIDFGLEVRYSNVYNGYRIVRDESLHIELVEEFFSNVARVDLN